MNLDELLSRPFCAFPDLIRLHAATRAAAPALTQDDRSLDYRALDALADRVAAALQRDGVRPQSAVAVCAGTSIAYCALLVGVLRTGAAIAPLPTAATAEQIAAMVDDAGASLLFVDRASAAALAPVRQRIRARCIALDDGDTAEPLRAWLAPEDSRPAAVEIQPEWPFNIIYSSGTTGTPKGIVQPHAMRWAQLKRASVFGYGPQAKTLISTPLHSNTTLVSLLPTLSTSGEAVLMAKFSATAFLHLAQAHRVTHAMLVPVQYQRIMGMPDFDRFDLSTFRFKFCTSAPFAAALKADVVRRWPGALIEYYGMTEGGGTCILEAHARPDKLHTVGQPAPGHDIRVIDGDGNELPAGATGEVVGRSPSMMTGYFNRPDETGKAEWHDAEGRRYIRTGDIGRFDGEGFLELLDRRKDMIITGGFNVFPSDLEAVLGAHPAVAEVAVVGVPSPRWGETPVAFVVPRAAVGTGELLAWANARLGKTQRISAVELLDELPRSVIGKVLKRELRDAWHVKTAPVADSETTN